MNRRRMTGHRANSGGGVDPLADVAVYWKWEGTGLTVDDALATNNLSLNSTTGVTWPASVNNNGFLHTTGSNSRFATKTISPRGSNPILDVENVGTYLAFSLSIWSKLSLGSYLVPGDPLSPALASFGTGFYWCWCLWREYHVGNYSRVHFATREEGGTVTTIQGNATYDDSNWHHYCVTREAGTNAAMKLYFDGSLLASGTSPGFSSDWNADGRWAIGSLNCTGAHSSLASTHFRNLGGLDETGYWTRALTAAEVAALAAGLFLA